jgi:hypothetical protein
MSAIRLRISLGQAGRFAHCPAREIHKRRGQGQQEPHQAQGGQVVPEVRVGSVCHRHDRVECVHGRSPDGERVEFGGRQFISSMALRDLILAFDPPPPDEVLRAAHAFPIYDHDYEQRVRTLRDYLAHFDDLQTIGRNGQYRYNNMDHSMLTGLYAARNVLGGHPPLEVWSVNTEPSYHEEGAGARPRPAPTGLFRYP